MSMLQNVAFKLVELFENPDESVMRLAGDTPVLVVGNCCCCCCCHCNFSLNYGEVDDGSGDWEQYAAAEQQAQ